MEIDPRTGALMDFERRRGDQPPPSAGKGSKRDRWGSKQLIATPGSINPVLAGIPAGRTFVDTGTLDGEFPINIQVRWGAWDPLTPSQPPTLFSPIFPLFAPDGLGLRAIYDLRRAIDKDAVPATDKFVQDLARPDVAPIDIVTSRGLALDVTIEGTTDTAVWVETIAAVVSDVAVANRLVGTTRANSFFQPAAVFGSPAHVVLLFPSAGRAQFTIVNTSVNSDLLLKFGNGNANWATLNGSIVLPRGQFATYESPVGGFRGRVDATWSDPAPDGGAIVTEMGYF